MSELKYTLRRDLTKNIDGRTLYRIEALKDFSNVKKGDLGGFVEKEDNLSQEGDCWVYEDACVYDDAKVYGDAIIAAYAKIYESAEIYNSACVSGNAKVFGMAEINGNASIYGFAYISGSVDIFGYAKVYDKATVDGCANISDYAEVYGEAKVSDYVIVGQYAKIYGHAHIIRNSVIRHTKDYYTCKCIWSDCKEITYTRPNNMWYYKGASYTAKELIKMMSEENESYGRYCNSMVEYVESLYKKIEDEKNNNINK